MTGQDHLELQRDADRYRWLRKHAVKIQGSQNWYQGYALDIRVDVGRDHVAVQEDLHHEIGGLLLRHQPD